MIVDAEASLMPRLPHPVHLLHNLPVSRHPKDKNTTRKTKAKTSVGCYGIYAVI